MKIPAWTILSGLGAMSRREICDLLAIFEDTSLFRMIRNRVSDLKNKISAVGEISEDAAFQKRLKSASKRLAKSGASDAVLRARLWEGVQGAFDLDSVLPLSTRSATVCTKSVAQAAADTIGDSLAVDLPR